MNDWGEGPRKTGPRRLRPLVYAGSLLLLVLVAAASRHAPQAASAAQTQPLLLRVYYQRVRDLSALSSYDIWENNRDERYALVAADANAAETLRRQGWQVEVDDAATARARSVNTRALFDQGYRTVDELYADLDAMAAAHPDLTAVFDYGQSYCKGSGGCVTPGNDQQAGVDLRAIRITNEAIPGGSTIGGGTVTRGTKPVLFLMGNIHSREITTPELMMRMAGWLLDGYGVDPEATWIVDWQEVWIVPTANPDGHWLVELGATPKYGNSPFYQRKNANRDADENGFTDCQAWVPTSWGQYGIDLNRNHSFVWGPPGSSNFPCDLTYRGPSMASEPETQALETLVRRLFADRRGPEMSDPAPADTTGMLITTHSYGDLVLWPWGFETDLEPPNKTALKAIGDKLATFSGAQSCQPADCLYGTNGSTDDWAYGELGVPALTFEIGYEFMPPYGDIDALQWPAYGPSFVYAAKIVGAPYRLAFGPDATDLSAVALGSGLVISALVTDEDNGGETIAAAEYSVDALFGTAGGDYRPMVSEGALDSPTEFVTATLDTREVCNGRHILFVRGQDSQGNWGPPSAVFFDADNVFNACTWLIPAALGG